MILQKTIKKGDETPVTITPSNVISLSVEVLAYRTHELKGGCINIAMNMINIFSMKHPYLEGRWFLIKIR